MERLGLVDNEAIDSRGLINAAVSPTPVARDAARRPTSPRSKSTVADDDGDSDEGGADGAPGSELLPQAHRCMTSRVATLSAWRGIRMGNLFHLGRAVAPRRGFRIHRLRQACTIVIAQGCLNKRHPTTGRRTVTSRWDCIVFCGCGRRRCGSGRAKPQRPGIASPRSLETHPKGGAPWERFDLEPILAAAKPREAYLWTTHNGAQLDLDQKRGRRFIL